MISWAVPDFRGGANLHGIRARCPMSPTSPIQDLPRSCGGTGLHITAWTSALFLICDLAGWPRPMTEAFSVMRPAIVAVILATLCILWLMRLPRPGGVTFLLPLTLLACWQMRPGPLATPETASALTLYQKNLLASAHASSALEHDIGLWNADIVTLQEISPRNRDILDRLRSRLPHQASCPSRRELDVAILSRFPLENVTCAPRAVGAIASTHAGDLVVASFRLYWPWPWRHIPDHPPQAAQAREISEMILSLRERGTQSAPRDAVLGADFNAPSWSATSRRLAQDTDGRPVQYAGASYAFAEVGSFTIGPRIDHVMVPRAWEARAARRGFLGSDHAGLVVQVDFER